MPRPRKHPKHTRPVKRILKEIRAKPLERTTASKIRKKQDIVGQDKRSDGLGSIGQATPGVPTAPSSLNMDPDSMGVLSYGVVHNSVVENPSGYGPVPGESGPLGNDSNATSLPTQDFFPAGRLSNAFSPSQTGGIGPEGATMTAPNPSSTRPPESGIYAVGVRADSRTEPLCAVFNSQTNYSCMLARVAERLPNVIIRNTTPAQRRRWYSTPAGQFYDPQRYAEFDLRAFDPFIPTVKLTMLLLEGDGPIDGVHVYLGRAVFTKLAELRIPLSVQEIVGFAGQSIAFGAMNWAMGQNGNAGMPTLPGPAPVAYNGVPGPSNMSHFGPPSFTTSPELFSSYSDPPDTMSAKTSLFSEPSWCASTISSLDSTVTPSNAMAEFMKNLADDVFVGYPWVESAAHDGDLDWYIPPRPGMAINR